MKIKQIISAVTAASIAASSLFTATVTADTQATMYTYTYEKTSHVIKAVQGGEQDVSGLYATSNTNIRLPGVTYGTTTYAELTEMYTGFTVEGFTLEECSMDSFTADDFEVYTFLMYDNWQWEQVDSPTMTFADLGLADTSVIQTTGYILRIKDSALVDSGVEIGDYILVNSGDAGYYTHVYTPVKQRITVFRGGDDVASGQYASRNVPIDVWGVNKGVTTFAELKKLYAGVSVENFVIESSSIEGLTTDDFEIYIYLMHGENSSWIQTWTSEMMLSDIDVADSDIIQEIGYVIRIKESTLVNLGLSVGSTVTINARGIYFENGILHWDPVEGAKGYMVRASNGVNDVYDQCISNYSVNIIPEMEQAQFKSGTYTIKINCIGENYFEYPIGTIDYELSVSETVEGDNTFTYKNNSDGTITITGGTINDKDVVIPSTIEGKPVTAINTNAFFLF